MLNEFLWSQLSGPLAQSIIDAIEYCDTDINPIVNYFLNLSIDTANEEELIIIGLLIGVPWPTAPMGTFDDSVFVFGEPGLSEMVIDFTRGFGDTETGRGGVFRESSYVSSQKMPISKYRMLLKAISKLKWGSLSFTVMDEVISVFSLNYIYLWDLATPTDIHIKVSSIDIFAGDLFILQKIFDRFAIDPYIEVSRGTI